MRASVLTIGTFDLLHVGHLHLLQQARALARTHTDTSGLAVGVNTDEFAESFKRSPIQNFEERCDTLETLGYHIERNDGPGFELIRFVQPHILVVGTDWARKDYYTQIHMTQDELDELEVILAYVPYTSGVSTTELIERIRRGE